MENEERNEPPRTQEAGDLLAGLFFAGLAIFAIVSALGFPQRGAQGFFTSPGFTPILLGGMILILSSILVAKAIRGGAFGEVSDWFRVIRESEESRRVLVITGLMTLYVAFIGVLDFALVTFVFVTATFFYVEAGKVWQILLYAGLITALVAYGLPSVFTMPLP